MTGRDEHKEKEKSLSMGGWGKKSHHGEKRKGPIPNHSLEEGGGFFLLSGHGSEKRLHPLLRK